MNRSPLDQNSGSRQYNRSTFTAPNLVLVEGPDEFHFLRFLRQRKDLQIHVYEGKDRLRLELKTIRAIEGYGQIKRVAIVRDADADALGSLHSVLAQWSSALGETIPNVKSDEAFLDVEGRAWHVWIMPQPNEQGDLEELLWNSVKENSHRTCIENMMNCLDDCDPIPFGSKTKARLYSWLATQRDPVKELYAALKQGTKLFDPNHPAFARFATLLDSLQASEI